MAIHATNYHAGMHVKEDELFPPQPTCPICLASGARRPALKLQADPDVVLLRCGRCAGYSASRMPSGETLRRYYAEYYKALPTAVACDDPDGFARHVMKRIGPVLKRDTAAILDFGGGGGDLSAAVAARLLRQGASHIEIELVDYNSHLCRPSSPQIALHPHQTLDTVRATDFDVVLASAVLEHIPEPRPVLVRLLSVLRPGGVLYARTPCMAPLLRVLQALRLPYDFTFPAHVHDMGQDFWEGILTRLPAEAGNFRLLCSRPSMVETSFQVNPFRTAIAYILKSPWYVLGRTYRFVGGWEVFIQRV